ncbi:fungal-specific transcription factor domain-containing protein [Rhexocercosporidium sp. MPI-PUGE-AT-0058]|nr:fungal-specific transcription factor domain-containing protein [Rhexocercosporidium sp. MPI-PUGE-AT-0058]
MEYVYSSLSDMGDRTSIQTGSSAGAEEDSNPACQSCRRRKLKCLRESPSCSQCIRLEVDCVYTSTRKPGMKSGAIEALNKRLQLLEDIVLRDDRNQNQAQTDPGSAPGKEIRDPLFRVSQVLIKELQKISSTSSITDEPDISYYDGNQRKRKRLETDDGLDLRNRLDIDDGSDLLGSLPRPEVLSLIVDKYFRVLQHWIPFLHQKRFELQLDNPVKKERNAVVLHAITCATLRFVKSEEHGMSQLEVLNRVRHSRQEVMLTALSQPSMENLQALIIVSFDHIGRGDFDKAWSLIGSLTRTVDYLRLAVEPEVLQRRPLRRPLTLLEPTNDWTEIEERRRLFWNIFLLDRYCSITTGWNTSLTSDDVHRKLPCDGGLWHREEPSDTPYFGIWNKSAAKIGNSIAFIPAHYPTPDHEIEPDNVRSPGVASNSAIVDTSKLGAFAYCIEATESLSQVTTFFLQQKIDFKNKREVGSWLTRFKELDLRLVHWKMFLPQQWKDSNISRDLSLVDMDPNLTLAHITHNTSMILLHQHIAYPPPHWNDLVKLPSSCSAETCQLAAIETSAICQKYLKYTENGIVNSQFALCAFIAGRILLVHWRFCNTELSPEFFSLVDCLYEMSRRWQGHELLDQLNSPKETGSSIAAQYATQLENFRSSLLSQPQFCMNILGYSQDSAGRTVDSLLPSIYYSPSPASPDTVLLQSQRQQIGSTYRNASRTKGFAGHSNIAHQSARMNDPRLPIDDSSPQNAIRTPRTSISNLGNHEWQTFHNSQPIGMASNMQVSQNNMQPNIDYDSVSVDDELTAMSNALLGQQFLEMDRVITYDGTNFAIDLDGWSGMN